MNMFANLGRTLSLLRELRGKSQTKLAEDAGIGKSQLSKYENGRELPKLESLEKVLGALEVGQFEFFYTLHLVDARAAALARERGPDGENAEVLPIGVPAAVGLPLLTESTDQAFTRVFNDMLVLYKQVFQESVFTGGDRRLD
jgi:transcriptional regulator with XRE-family HTH domain